MLVNSNSNQAFKKRKITMGKTETATIVKSVFGEMHCSIATSNGVAEWITITQKKRNEETKEEYTESVSISKNDMEKILTLMLENKLV